jgi:transposase-like protein
LTTSPKRTKKGTFAPLLPPSKRSEVVALAINEYCQGVSVQDIAKKHSVDRGTIYDWMLGGLGGDGYEDLVTRVLVARVRMADQELEEAREPHHIARARERARFARMDLERRRPNLYGQKTHVTVENVGDLADKLRRARERVIEGEKPLRISESDPAGSYVTIQESPATD